MVIKVLDTCTRVVNNTLQGNGKNTCTRVVNNTLQGNGKNERKRGNREERLHGIKLYILREVNA